VAQWVPVGIVVATFIFAGFADRIATALHERLREK